MHNKLSLLINNCTAVIETVKSQDKRINNENIFENDKVKPIIDMYWKDIKELDDSLNLNFSKEDLIIELRNVFPIEIEENETFIQDYYLETWLYNSKLNNKETRFNKYKVKLRQAGMGSVVDQLERDTYTILDRCNNPNLKASWDRRGLVYGHVQSGKTANYIGLINRAFDHGYKIVIVLTGMTEDLRRQTQERIDEFIDNNKPYKIVKPTNLKDDFSSKFKYQHNENISYRDHSIWVIKKNKTVLENLILWFDEQRKKQNSQFLKGTPVLIIDDEADNASIQSISTKHLNEWEVGLELQKKDEEDLSEQELNILNDARERVIKAINRNIRVLLSLIGSKTFVGYTATPYSIVTQEYEDIDNRPVNIKGIDFKITAGDLFPEHFIMPIKPGKTYLGIERLFNDDEEKNIPAVINLNDNYKNEDYDDIFPTKRGREYLFKSIPQSLKNAINHYITSIIIKKYRGINEYNSMLIHTSHLTLNQDYVAFKVDEYIAELRNKIVSNNNNLLNEFNKCLSSIKQKSGNELYKSYFNLKGKFPDKITNQDLFLVLKKIIHSPFEVVSYHSSKSDELMHKHHDLNYSKKLNDDGNEKFTNYIVVGGNRLSRGLTLKGLIVSYFVRSSTRQDSLYQMGRWFGYRKGYEDLVEVYMPNDHILWYESIYKLEMDLRNDFERNNDVDNPILPRNAIIKLSHEIREEEYRDESLTKKKFPYICDKSKLRKTQSGFITHNGAKSTKLIEIDIEKANKNLSLIYDLFDDLFNKENKSLFNNDSLPESEQKNDNISFTNISNKYIIPFIKNFNFHPKEEADIKSFCDFILKNEFKVNDWSISLVNRKTNPEFEMNKYDVSKFYNLQIKEKFLKFVTRTAEDYENNSLRLTQILERRGRDSAFDIVNNENIDSFKKDPKSTYHKLRRESKNALLLIYPVYDKDRNIEYPVLYFYYPRIKNAYKVKYIIKKDYE